MYVGSDKTLSANMIMAEDIKFSLLQFSHEQVLLLLLRLLLSGRYNRITSFFVLVVHCDCVSKKTLLSFITSPKYIDGFSIFFQWRLTVNL